MAIVFSSPKKTQRMLLRIIILLLVSILSIFPFIIFSYKFVNGPQNITTKAIDRPDIRINFSTIDSDKVKNLELFGPIEAEFSYIAEDKNGKQAIGKISALSKDNAKKFLEGQGFKVSVLEETVIGKNEPFIPY